MPTTKTDAPLSMSMSTRDMAREQDRNARLKALRDGTFEEVNMDDDTIVEALVEALAAAPSPAGTIEPVADEADEPLWISDAVCETPFVDAAIVISDDEDDEESEVAEVAEVGQGPRLPFSCPFMLRPTHDSDPDPDHDLTCPESPVSPASPAAPEAPEAVEAVEDYIDTVARRRAANDALRAGFAKARAAIEAIEEEEELPPFGRATPPIAAEVMALQVVSVPQARQPPDTQVTVADTEMVAEATEAGSGSAPDAPLPHASANGTMPRARSAAALRSLGTWSPAAAIRKSRRSSRK